MDKSQWEALSKPRVLQPGQRARVWILDTIEGTTQQVHEDTEVLLEAPNWTREGMLLLNGDGVLWAMPADGSSRPARVETDGLPKINNDHVLHPLRDAVIVSASDGQLYEVPLAGGSVRRITDSPQGYFHFLHGVSPDGQRLAYVSLDFSKGMDTRGVLHTVGIDGTDDRPLGTSSGPDDGPEYSPDGEWIYFNTEQFSTRVGHAQIARIKPDGTGLEQLTFDERVNWFPHISPDNQRAIYLSYPTGTERHPADLPVQLRLVVGDRWSEATVAVELFGGQGTINVPSWSPDGRHLAFVDYPVGLSGNTLR